MQGISLGAGGSLPVHNSVGKHTNPTGKKEEVPVKPASGYNPNLSAP